MTTTKAVPRSYQIGSPDGRLIDVGEEASNRTLDEILNENGIGPGRAFSGGDELALNEPVPPGVTHVEVMGSPNEDLTLG